MTTAFLGLGSNIGHRHATLRSALQRIAAIPGTSVAAVADFRETLPVDCPPQTPPFLNSVAQIQTTLSAQELLRHLQHIESDLGRVRSAESRHQSRTLDLDLLLFGDDILSLPELTLPHPRMHQRLFVLEPLAEIAPDCRHPLTGKTARQMLRDVQTSLAGVTP